RISDVVLAMGSASTWSGRRPSALSGPVSKCILDPAAPLPGKRLVGNRDDHERNQAVAQVPARLEVPQAIAAGGEDLDGLRSVVTGQLRDNDRTMSVQRPDGSLERVELAPLDIQLHDLRSGGMALNQIVQGLDAGL